MLSPTGSDFLVSFFLSSCCWGRRLVAPGLYCILSQPLGKRESTAAPLQCWLSLDLMSVFEAIVAATLKALIRQIKCPPSQEEWSQPFWNCMLSYWKMMEWMPEGRWKHQVSSSGKLFPFPPFPRHRCTQEEGELISAEETLKSYSWKILRSFTDWIILRWGGPPHGTPQASWRPCWIHCWFLLNSRCTFLASCASLTRGLRAGVLDLSKPFFFLLVKWI